ncbi:MAG: hypothetical protein H7837_00160 [Magnetococcus sp. MYC-9]
MEISKELGLPPFVKTNLLPLELNYYGAARMVADRLGIKDPPVSYVSWKHGWIPEIMYVQQLAADSHIGVNGHPDATVILPAHKKRPYLVGVKAQETLLQENGFPDSKAVGLPFSYVERDPAVQRVPGSLLVMPTHVLTGNTVVRADEIEYLEYIQSIAHLFSRVVFCVNLGCLSNGLWINNLEKYGFDYVWGAGMMDQMALFRMRRIFDTFEYMTSHGMGSHVVYAGLCGVKVSLAGPLDHCPQDMNKNIPAWRDEEQRKGLIHAARVLQHDYLKKRYPWLYTEPNQGVECVEWAKEEIGYHNKVSFEELAQLFGWRSQKTVRSESFLEAAFRVDSTGNVAEFVQFAQTAPHDPQAMLQAVSQLLASKKVRSAYILAMLLAKRGYRNAVTALAHSMGGLVYNNPAEMANGLDKLPSLVDALSGEQQRVLIDQLLVPNLSPVLSAAMEEGSDPLQIQRILSLVHAAAPRLRDSVRRENASETLSKEEEQRQRAHAQQLLQDWQEGGV